MSKCQVLLCEYTSKICNKKMGITFHRFPKNHVIRDKWIDATGRTRKWSPSLYSVICSEHFCQDLFKDIGRSRRFLHKDAVPTLNLPMFNRLNITPAVLDAPGPTTVVGQFEVIQGNLPNSFDDLEKRKMMRTIEELNNRVRSKNLVIKRLRESQRVLKKKYFAIKSRLAEVEEKKTPGPENTSKLSHLGSQTNSGQTEACNEQKFTAVFISDVLCTPDLSQDSIPAVDSLT